MTMLSDSDWEDTDEFLARIEYMPDTEAEDELVKRRSSSFERLNTLLSMKAKLRKPNSSHTVALTREQVGEEIFKLGNDNAKVNLHLGQVRKRMETIYWKKAVQAVYGDEGVFLIKKWMIENDPRKPLPDQYGPHLRRLMQSYGLVEKEPEND